MQEIIYKYAINLLLDLIAGENIHNPQEKQYAFFKYKEEPTVIT